MTFQYDHERASNTPAGYPPMRACRNLLIRLRGVPKMGNLENRW